MDKTLSTESIRRLVFWGSAFTCTIIPTYLFADLLWRTEFNFLKGVLVMVFSLLTLPVSVGFNQTIFGFFRLVGRKETKDNPSQTLPDRIVSINIPVYNEDIAIVLERVRAVYKSLEEAGQLHAFDFYILSDSTYIDNWIKEEFTWARLCRQLKAFDRIYYRRRRKNDHQKAGNILNFCESWGRRYKYMVIFDADSLMDGDTLVEMVRRMDANPKLGILQTVPRLIRGQSLFGKIQQFANACYGRYFSEGLAWWCGNKGNYWGHNAIIRVKPFIDYCALPDLPGRPPLGGKILSHDFVEAALMVKAGYHVQLATDLEGSFEEGPQDILETAKRDRRWCQGNLQHFWLLFADGIRGVSKIHFLNGIFAFVGSLLWLIFLVISIALAFERSKSQLSMIPVSSTVPMQSLSITEHGLLVFGILFVMLLAPKFLALLEGIFHKAFRQAFGGWQMLLKSITVEFIYSTLVAPIFMLFHSQFVLLTLFGKGISWSSQNRNALGIPWGEAWAMMRLPTLVGILGFLLALRIDGSLIYWLTPIWLGLAGSVPLAVWSSRQWDAKVCETPYSLTRRLRIIDLLEEGLKKDRLGIRLSDTESFGNGFTNVVADPYMNAIHVTLLKGTDRQSPVVALEDIHVESLFGTDPNDLDENWLKTILVCDSILRHLHREVWRMSESKLHPVWRNTLSRYDLKPLFSVNE